jgi:molecular chaperone DnaJ
MTMTEVAIWRVLGIDPTTDRKAIRKAYRSRARQLHPDLNPSEDAARRFAALESAYREALRRAPSAAAPAPNWAKDIGGFSFDPEPPHAPPPAPDVWQVPRFDEQLSDLFGPPAHAAPQSAAVAERGADIHASMQVTFAQALAGETSILPVRVQLLCEDCHGSGQLHQRCEICQGSGRMADGNRCWNCRGTGQTSTSACPACHASGLRDRMEQVPVVVPPGSRHSTVLRISGAGSAGMRQRGDLVVTLAVAAHPDFTFGPGGTLVRDLQIDVATAGLGGTRTIELPDGSPYRLRIPAMVADRREIIIPGRGWPDAHGKAGDVHVRLLVGFPSELNQQMREALRAFREAASQVDTDTPSET